MNLNVVLDIKGRLRLRLRPEELDPLAYQRLSALLAKGGDVKSVSFNCLTGSLLVIYEKDEALRRRILSKIIAFEPSEKDLESLDEVTESKNTFLPSEALEALENAPIVHGESSFYFKDGFWAFSTQNGKAWGKTDSRFSLNPMIRKILMGILIPKATKIGAIIGAAGAFKKIFDGITELSKVHGHSC
ncbi:MAG: hypothetical protein LBE38_02195 [Deltaproteobacteria bacterium]|jgi:hypothetical protein|nr:hypothetical protein [Deltaproteobacteria bacterium]